LLARLRPDLVLRSKSEQVSRCLYDNGVVDGRCASWAGLTLNDR
jgi:hypothetical protein